MTLVRSSKLPAEHPELTFRKVLKTQYVSISDAAKKMHINRPHLNNFTTGKVGVTVLLAMKLEISTGISAGFWLNLQKTYDLFTHRYLVIDCEPLF